MGLHKSGEENKLSSLIRASFGEQNVLFLGDAEGDSLSRLWKTSTDLSALVPLFPDNTDIVRVAQWLRSCVEQYYAEGFNPNFQPDEGASLDYWNVYSKINNSMGYCLGISDLIIRAGVQDNNSITGNDELNDSVHKIFCDNFHSWLGACSEEDYLIFASEALDYVKEITQNQEDEIQIDSQLTDCITNATSNEDFQRLFEMFSPLVVDQIFKKANEDPNFLQKTRTRMLSQVCSEVEININENHAFLLTRQLIHALAMRKLFKDSQIIFLPHHGTQTKNSQNFLGLFAGMGTPHTFIVSSSPFGSNHLPKASTLDMAPIYPEHPLHYFLYTRDFIDEPGQAQLKLTNKPIYMTGAAPDGVITIMIRPDDGNAYMLDLMKRNDNYPYRWIFLPPTGMCEVVHDEKFASIPQEDAKKYYRLYF